MSKDQSTDPSTIIQPPQTLGQFLRAKRELKGASIEQVSSSTKLTLKTLKHLEEDQLAEIPSMTHLKGFLKTYSNFLGISFESLLNEYGEYIQFKLSERTAKDKGFEGFAFERNEGEQTRKRLWIIMGSMLIFGVLVLLVFKPNLKHKKHKNDVVKTEEAVDLTPSPPVTLIPPVAPTVSSASPPEVKEILKQMGLPASTPGSLTTQLPAVPPPAERKPDLLNSGADYLPQEIQQKVLLKAKRDVWVRYQCDDKKMMKFILREGKMLVLRGKKVVALQLSDPQAVVIRSKGIELDEEKQKKHSKSIAGTDSFSFPEQEISTVEELFKNTNALPR